MRTAPAPEEVEVLGADAAALLARDLAEGGVAREGETLGESVSSVSLISRSSFSTAWLTSDEGGFGGGTSRSLVCTSSALSSDPESTDSLILAGTLGDKI